MRIGLGLFAGGKMRTKLQISVRILPVESEVLDLDLDNSRQEPEAIAATRFSELCKKTTTVKKPHATEHCSRSVETTQRRRCAVERRCVVSPSHIQSPPLLYFLLNNTTSKQESNLLY